MASKWTLFWDMNSGGGTKEDYDKIYVELPEDKAAVWFYNRFGHSPYRVSCTCCGGDYSISESESLEQASGYHRNCKYDRDTQMYLEERGDWGTYKTVEEYKKDTDVLIVPREEVKDEELTGDVPTEGYVWMD